MLSLLCSPHHWSALEPDASAERGGPDNARTARGQRLDSTRAALSDLLCGAKSWEIHGFFRFDTVRFSEAARVVPWLARRRTTSLAGRQEARPDLRSLGSVAGARATEPREHLLTRW